MDKHEQFKRIYKKYIDGKRWIAKKEQEWTITQQDRDDFEVLVASPLKKLWAMFNAQEKEDWLKVHKIVDMFEGTLVFDDEIKKPAVKRSLNKRWKRYSRRY